MMMEECDGIIELNRSEYEFEDLCQRFCLTEKKYDIQYHPYNCARLRQLRNDVQNSAKAKWGQGAKIVHLAELVNVVKQKICLIGTLYKRMTLQPTILKELSEDNQLVPQPVAERYISEDDALYLQGDGETVQLVGDIEPKLLVTGIVIAVWGHCEADEDKFHVEEHCFAGLPPVSPSRPLEDDKYVAIVSGIGFSKKTNVNLLSARNMFIDFITGNCSGTSDALKASKIVKLIVAGNLISKDVKNHEQEENRQKNIAPWTRRARPYTLEILQMIDDFLLNLSKSIDVDVMPGEHDAVSQILPQQPLHPCVIPKSSAISSIRCVTNPYAAKFDGILFVGTSGQNIASIKQSTELTETLDVMGNTLEWAHLCPTAPDTLHSYPYPDKDPFILSECPQIYFAGNQATFNTKLIHGPDDEAIRIVSVPQFESSFNCVLINLRNLECELVAFG